MVVVLSLLLIILILQLSFVVWNISQLPVMGEAEEKSDSFPSVSILIPARNEASTLAGCLDRILRQTHPPEEVWILNDHSEDGTEEIASAYASQYPNVYYLNGEALEAGWLGKSFACHQLAQQAASDWFLFLDADVRLGKDALQHLLPVLKRQKNGMISGFPFQETKTWMEKLIVPMMTFTIACHLPIRFVRSSADPKFAAAHGGFLAVEKTTYFKTGGHHSIRSALVDDMALAKTAKRNGFPFSLLDIHQDVSMRMYTRADEVWKGYRKNLFPGVGKNPILLLGMLLFYVLLYICPLIFGVIALVHGQVLITFLCLLAYLTGVLIKGIIDRKNGISLKISFFLPVSILLLIGIGLDSMRIHYSKQGYEWKGRRYQ